MKRVIIICLISLSVAASVLAQAAGGAAPDNSGAFVEPEDNSSPDLATGPLQYPDIKTALSYVPDPDPRSETLAAYQRDFGVDETSGPELQIWTTTITSREVVGYVARPGVLYVFEMHHSSNFWTGQSTRTVTRQSIPTRLADDLIAMIPDLRNVQFDRCQRGIDGHAVIVGGQDAEGDFGLSAVNWDRCEGQNVDVLSRAVKLAATKRPK